MTWILFKSSFKKSWLWLKEHWQLPFLLAWSIGVYILTRRNTDALLEVMEAKKDSYRKQVEVLRSTHNDEILKRDMLTEEYDSTLKKVKEVYDSEDAKLTEKHKNEIKEAIIKSKGDPSEIKRRIEKEFGIKFI